MWNKRPTAAELLKDRLDNGWRPTPSSLKDGDSVQGYAACMFDAES